MEGVIPVAISYSAPHLAREADVSARSLQEKGQRDAVGVVQKALPVYDSSSQIFP